MLLTLKVVKSDKKIVIALLLPIFTIQSKTLIHSVFTTERERVSFELLPTHERSWFSHTKKGFQDTNCYKVWEIIASRRKHFWLKY